MAIGNRLSHPSTWLGGPPSLSIKLPKVDDITDHEAQTLLEQVIERSKITPIDPVYAHFLEHRIEIRNYTNQTWMKMQIKDTRSGSFHRTMAAKATMVINAIHKVGAGVRSGQRLPSGFNDTGWLNETWRLKVEKYLKGTYEIKGWARKHPTSGKTIASLKVYKCEDGTEPQCPSKRILRF